MAAVSSGSTSRAASPATSGRELVLAVRTAVPHACGSFVTVVDEAGEHYFFRDWGLEAGDCVQDGFGKPARFASQDELVRYTAGGVRLDEPHQVFARLQGAEIEQVGWDDLVFLVNGR